MVHHQSTLVEGWTVLTPLSRLELHPQPQSLPLLSHGAGVERRVGLLQGADDEAGDDLSQRHAVTVYGDPALTDEFNLGLS